MEFNKVQQSSTLTKESFLSKSKVAEMYGLCLKSFRERCRKAGIYIDKTQKLSPAQVKRIKEVLGEV
jgi:hypothetical protein